MVLGNIFALDRTQCDLSFPEKIPDVVRAFDPDVIVNTAAYTAVDKAEEDEALATTVNATSVGVLAEEAYKLNSLLIHYSTDYVFDGKKQGPYTEDDIPNPINVYGRSKLAGETAIIQSGCDYLIFRTSWVYAARGNNFLITMLRLARERNELRVVADQYGAPTWARNIADSTAHAMVSAERERQDGAFTSNVYHLSADGATTWHGFTNAIIERARQLFPAGYIKTERVLPIATEDYPLLAARPENSQLGTDALAARYGQTLPNWQESLKLCIDEMKSTH